MRRHVALILLWLFAVNARAGGHFDVDDAFTLDPGQCQNETWYGRFGTEPVTDFHLGPACRVGPVELSANFDRYSVPDLHGRVVILDKNNTIIAVLGNNSGPMKHDVPQDQWIEGIFNGTHGSYWDKDGNLYVQDWNVSGRLMNLVRVK